MKKIFTFLTTAVMALSLSAGEITVADGTQTSLYVPITCSYGDEVGTRTQFIYPASMLADLAGNNLTSITFYADKEITWATYGTPTVPELAVRMKEVDVLALTDFFDSSDLTEVYSGQPTSGVSELAFEFDQPFAYSEGKNLLVEVVVVTKGGYQTLVNFYGNTNSDDYGCSYSKYGSNSQKSYFLPKATIVYNNDAPGATCAKPSQLTSSVSPNGAVFTWQAEQGAQHQVCVVEKDAAATEWKLLEADVFTYTAKGLTAGKAYDFYVRTYCSESEQSTAVKVSFSPACNAPANVEASAIEATKATVSWEAATGISKYQYVCVEQGDEYSWEGVEAKAGLSVTIDTLLANTAYDFYVRSYFSDKVQSEAAKLSFTTNCEAASLPFREAFLETTLPDCWNTDHWGSSYNNWSINSTLSALQYNARTSSSAEISTPSIDLSEEAVLTFKYLNRYGASGYAVNFDIIVLDASNDAQLMSESITTPSPSGEDEWAEASIDLSELTGKIVKIKFIGYGASSSTSCYLRISTLQVKAKPCNVPTELKAEPSSDGAVVTWQSNAAAFALRYKAVSASDWTTVNDLEEATYTITGLASGAEYEVQVQAVCNAEKQSKWSSSVKFTLACGLPTNVLVSEITEDAAVVTWESSESKFNLQYKAAADAEWKEVKDLSDKSYTLSGLQASTAYEVQVQSACGSEFSKPVSFTTACAPQADAIPYKENFEGAGEGTLSECWARRSENEYPLVELTTGARGATEESKANCLVFRGENEQIAILPAFDQALSGLTLSFFYKMSANTAALEVGYLVSLYGEFQALAELEYSNTYAAEAHAVNLKECPAGAKYVAIRYTSTSSYATAFVDDLALETSPEGTAINNTEAVDKATKHIVNGQLIIEMNGIRYNAQGAVMK